MGIPVTTPTALTNLNAREVVSQAAYIILFISITVAFLLIFLTDRFKGLRETWPAILICDDTFAMTQFLVLKTLEAELVDNFTSRYFFVRSGLIYKILEAIQKKKTESAFMAWLPFILLTVMII